MKTGTKIKAFTLAELIVVLILTSIVVGVAFSVLTLVQKQMLTMRSHFNSNTELTLLDQSLWIDFNRYSEIKYYPESNSLILSYGLDSTRYRFIDDKIIKGFNTLNVSFKSKTIYLNAAEVNAGLVDALKLTLSSSGQDHILFVFKQNDAATYLK